MKRLISVLIFFLPANASFNNKSTTPSAPLTQIATGVNSQQTSQNVHQKISTNPIPNNTNLSTTTPMGDIELTANRLNIPQALRPQLQMLAALNALNIYKAHNPITPSGVVTTTIDDNHINYTLSIPSTVNAHIFSQLVDNQLINFWGFAFNFLHSRSAQNQQIQRQRPDQDWANFKRQNSQLPPRKRATLYLKNQAIQGPLSEQTSLPK